MSAILDIRKSSTFEGEASTSLQFAAEKWLDAQKKKIAGSEDFAESGIITDYGELKSISDVAQKSVVEKNNSINRNIKADYIIYQHYLLSKKYEKKTSQEKTQQISLPLYIFMGGLVRYDCFCLRKSKRKKPGLIPLHLSGGVYQNKLLLDYSVTMLEERGFHVLRHHFASAK
ncbi:MAG: hypothetical protein ACLRYY_07990 [Anaerobutyricum soehngenii]